MLVPNPSYPIHPYGFIIAGGSIRHIPVPGSTSLAEFLPALERAVRYAVPKPIALVLNYPSNPTAQVVDLDFYAAIVDFCKRQGIWILSDLAYAEIYFDGMPPPSVLQVPGARDIAVEFTSMSKTYSMAGWRIGFAAGNKTLIQALTRIKSYLDYGAFTPIQVAATAALNGPQDCIAEARNTYKERRDVLIEGLTAAGWDLPAPSASMFAWAPIPQAVRRAGLARVLEAAADAGQCRGVARHRLRRAWRRLRPHRPGREQASHPPGDPQHPPGDGRSRRARSISTCAASGTTSRRSRLAPDRILSYQAAMTGPLKIGIAGLGTVGAGVVKLLAEHDRLLSLRGGRRSSWSP